MAQSFLFSTLMEMLVKHEGLKLKPYKDTVGKLTIGIGRNLEDQGISKSEALVLLVNDIEKVHKESADAVKTFSTLSDARKLVVMSMIFNMGLTRFLGFKKFIQFVEVRDFDNAAKEMLNSLWATQVKGRAVELADMMKSGSLNEVGIH